MAQTAAYQLQRTDIRINSICPGLIETGMTDATFEYARKRGTAGKIGQLNPLGRYGIPEGLLQCFLGFIPDYLRNQIQRSRRLRSSLLQVCYLFE